MNNPIHQSVAIGTEAELFSLNTRYLIPPDALAADLLEDASTFMGEAQTIIELMGMAQQHGSELRHGDLLMTAARLVEMAKGALDAAIPAVPGAPLPDAD